MNKCIHVHSRAVFARTESEMLFSIRRKQMDVSFSLNKPNPTVMTGSIDFPIRAARVFLPSVSHNVFFLNEIQPPNYDDFLALKHDVLFCSQTF